MNNATPTLIKLTRHCACKDCGDTMEPGEWADKLNDALYCHGCAELILDAQEWDKANWAEMLDCGYLPH